MIVVLKCHKAKRLQYTVGRFAHGAENFGHAVHGACLRLEGNLNKVALSQRLRDAQQPASHRNGLELGFSAPAVFEPNCRQDRISQLYTSRAPRWVRLGEVGHIAVVLSHHPLLRNRLPRPIVRIPHHKPELTIPSPINLKDLAPY
jgi:hypothetical protein